MIDMIAEVVFIWFMSAFLIANGIFWLVYRRELADMLRNAWRKWGLE